MPPHPRSPRDASASRAAIPPLLDNWKPASPDLVAAFPGLVAAAAAKSVIFEPPWSHSPAAVDLVKVGALDAVTCLWAEPHTDSYSDEWFVLWVLFANGHRLFAADCTDQPTAKSRRITTSAPQERAKRADFQAPLDVGDLVILSANRLHWLDPSPAIDEIRANPKAYLPDPNDDVAYDKRFPGLTEKLRPYFFVAASVGLKDRPSRSEAEALLLQQLRPVRTDPLPA